jgi:type I restriction enzyme S subunit
MNERELPAGWSAATIEDIAIKVGSGATPKGGEAAYKPTGIPLIRSTNVIFFGFRNEGLAFIDSAQADALSNATVSSGDVLLNITGASIGRVTTAPDWANGARVNQHVCIIRPSNAISADYLAAYLSSPEFQSYVWSDNYGVTRQALTKKQILDVFVPLPPQAEQRRISAKLDTTLASVESCRQRLEGVAALLKRFRQAVLEAATTGELTREWREEQEISDEWNNKKLGQLLDDMRYGTAKKCSYEAAGLPVLRIPNILESGRISREDLKFADFDSSEITKLSIHPGDLLVIRSNGSLDLVGRVAEAGEQDAGMLFAGYLIRLRPNQEKVLSSYLALNFRAPSARRVIELAARSTSGVNNINSQFLSSLSIPLPEIDEQHEIIRRAQQLFALADQLEAKLSAARQVVERLTPALLAKAFRGELVPQDSSDEPASVLLERIRAARQAEAAAGKPSRRGRKKAAAKPAPSVSDAAPVPPDLLAGLLRECGALSERALLAASDLAPEHFQRQLAIEMDAGRIREDLEEGERVLVMVG